MNVICLPLVSLPLSLQGILIKKIKGKRIRDDLMFNKGEEEASRSLNTYRQVFKILDGMENDWTHDQKLVKKEKLRAEMEKVKGLESSLEWFCGSASYMMVR